MGLFRQTFRQWWQVPRKASKVAPIFFGMWLWIKRVLAAEAPLAESHE